MSRTRALSRPFTRGASLAVLATLVACVCLAAAACGAAPVATTATLGPGDTTGTSSTATGVSTAPSSQGTSVTDITMVQPGSPNQAIYQALGWNNVYVVYSVQIQDGWAYVHAIPFTSTEGPTIDTRALLRQDTSGQWQVLEKSTTEGLLTDVGAVAEDQDVPAQFKSKHPDAPAALFPEVKTGDKSIMDAVRTALGNPQYRFNVFVLNASGDWAYTELRALAYQAGRISESRDMRALLKQTGGTWQVQQMEGMDARQQSEFVAALKAQYPDIPAGVLP
jgi:hypothetical protein